MTASLLPPVRERGPEPAVSVAGEGLTYGELREAAAALAAELQGAERVAVWADEGALALSIWETAELWATGRVPEPLGSAHRLTAPYQALRTRDGHITVGGNNERLWERLCNAIGRADLLDDARFAGNDARMRNRGELAAELEAALEERDTGEWVEALLAAGVPCGPIHDYADVVADRHTLARAMVVELEHPVEGTVRALGMPLKLSATPGEIRRPAPLLGEHTEEVLREAGLAADEIAEVVR